MSSQPTACNLPEGQRSLWRHRNFRHLWAGDALGQFGAQIAGFVLPIFAVAHLHATEWQMGLLSAFGTAAFLLIGLPAGAWVDRMCRRSVLIWADLVRAGLITGVAIALLTGHASIWLLMAVTFALSVANLFFDVAQQSYLPELVGKRHLSEANSKLQALASVAQVSGPSIGGFLIRTLAMPFVFVTTIVTYLTSALLVSRINLAENPTAAAKRRRLRTEIAEGLAWVARQELLRRIVMTTALSNFVGAIAGAVETILLLRIIGLDPTDVGLAFSIGSVGGVLGAISADRVRRWIGEGRTIALSALATAVPWIMLPLAAYSSIPLVLISLQMFFSGFLVVVYNVAQVSFRQRICPPDLLGRMNASVRFIVWGTIPIGGIVGGWLGHQWGALTTIWVTVPCLFLAAMPVMFSRLVHMREIPDQ